MNRRAERNSVLRLALAALLVSTPSADSDEYSAQAVLETTVVTIDSEPVLSVRSPLLGAGVLVVAGLTPGPVVLGPDLPVLHVGPPFFVAGGMIGPSGNFQLPYRVAASYPAGQSLFVQAFVTTGSGDVWGSRPLRLVPGAAPTTWTDGTGLLPPVTGDYGGGDVDWGDLDKDGWLDAVVATAGASPPPLVLMNQGASGLVDEAASRFPPEALLPTVCVELADVDADGHLDVFLGTGPEALAPLDNVFLWNDGTGHFTADPTFPGGNGLAVDCEFGDVDGDGDLDAFVLHADDPDHGGPTDPPDLYLFEGGGYTIDPVFSSLPGNTPLEVDGDVSLGDIDNDGDLDLHVANSGPVGGGGQNRLYRNDGLGTFTDITAQSLPYFADSSFEADFVDIDKDGRLDLFVANSLTSGAGINLLLNLGPVLPGDPPVFLDGEALFIGPFPGSSSIRLACDVADVDGDGDQDIGVGLHHLFDPFGQPEGESFLLLNQGGLQGGITGSYLVDPTFGTFGAAFVAGDLSFADVDNDGDVDCYVTSNGDLLGQQDPQDVLILNQL